MSRIVSSRDRAPAASRIGAGTAEAPAGGAARHARERWTATQLALAAAAIVLCGAVLLSKVDYSGAWDGDPSIHSRHAMETVNVFVAEWRSGGDPLKAFLHSYFAFPKMLHESLVAAFTLGINGLKPIGFGEIEFFGAWFATIWTIAGLLGIYAFARAAERREVVLLTMPLIALSGYVLLYANFPRHNMPSHALVWLASALYVYWRARGPHLSPRQGLALGLLFGFGIPVHYSAIYWAIWLGAAELALLLWDRASWRKTAWALALFGAGALVVPALVEGYFHLYSHWYSAERDWWGHVIATRDYSFLDGLLLVLGRLWTQAMAYKMASRDLLFLPGLLYRSFGPVGLLLLIAGTALSVRSLLAHGMAAPQPRLRATAIVLTGLLVSLAISLEFFQNARKLATYYPAWAALMAIGLGWTFDRVRAGLAAWPSPGLRPRPVALVVTAAAVLGGQLVSFYPQGSAIYHARRDAGYMREYLAANGIDRILVMPLYVASQMAPTQLSMVRYISPRVTLSEADQFEHIVLHRLYTGVHGEELMDCVRQVEPIVSFANQVSLPLFYYEFPLVKDFMDFDDPLTRTRSLYRWPELRAACLDRLLERRNLVDDRVGSRLPSPPPSASRPGAS